MIQFELVFPADYDEYAWEYEAKGYIVGVLLVTAENSYPLNFFEPVRLAQDIGGFLDRNPVYFEPNLVVVPSVTRDHMLEAARYISSHPSLMSGLVPVVP